jgi:hypothetical protein
MDLRITAPRLGISRLVNDVARLIRQHKPGKTPLKMEVFWLSPLGKKITMPAKKSIILAPFKGNIGGNRPQIVRFNLGTAYAKQDRRSKKRFKNTLIKPWL